MKSEEKHATWVSIAQRYIRMLTLLVTPTRVFIRIRASTLGGTSPVSRSTTASMVVMGKISKEMSPNSEISSEIS
jgi:hypothetical protein